MAWPAGERIVYDVHRPSITPILPATFSETQPVAAVLLIPGGGHQVCTAATVTALPLHSVYVACAAPLAPRACSSQRYSCCQCGLCSVQHACTPAYAGTSPRRLPSRSLIWRLSEWRSVRGCLVWGICRTERPYIPLTTNTRRCASTSRGRLSGAGWLSAELPPSF